MNPYVLLIALASSPVSRLANSPGRPHWLSALELVNGWAAVTSDRSLSDKLEAQRNQRLQQRVDTLTRSYAGAPELLEFAISCQLAVHTDNDVVQQSRVAAIRAQAAQLGDAANARQRYVLAVDYYNVAGQDAKAQAAQEAQRKLATAGMQPQIDQMKKQAQQMQQEFSDPARIQAMREQALAMQKSLQQQQSNAGANAKADDLEKELGL